MSRNRLRRLLVAVAAVAVAATASPARAQQSPGATIAAALRTSPVYVHPSLQSALPPADQQQLVQEIRATGIPIYVIVVPLVTGDHWGGDPEQLATIVHERLGADGVFLTLDKVDGALSGYEWPDEKYQAFWAAATPFHEKSLENAGLRARFSRAIELVASGNGKKAYEKATADLDDGPDGGTVEPIGDPLWMNPYVAAIVMMALGTVIEALRRRARRRKEERGGGLALPRQVFLTAQNASTEELRERAAKELVALGELVEDPGFAPVDPKSTADLQHALDAYAAGGKVLDHARGLPDLAGVLVLVDIGRDRLARAKARAENRRVPKLTPLCFFNPLHGDSVQRVTWRPLGTRNHAEVAACADCVKTLKKRQAPKVLSDRIDGREVPYFEVPPSDSVWSATGYGALRHDLVQRILRGDFSRTRA